MSNNELGRIHQADFGRLTATIDDAIKNCPERMKARRMLFGGNFTAHGLFERGVSLAVKNGIVDRFASVYMTLRLCE